MVLEPWANVQVLGGTIMLGNRETINRVEYRLEQSTGSMATITRATRDKNKQIVRKYHNVTNTSAKRLSRAVDNAVWNDKTTKPDIYFTGTVMRLAVYFKQ